MKKTISVILILLFLVGTVFAVEPYPIKQTNIELFTNVEGTQLSNSDMKQVEGEGLIGAIGFAFLGAVGGALKASITTAYRTAFHKEKWNTSRNRRRIVSAAKHDAVYGAVWGFITGP